MGVHLSIKAKLVLATSAGKELKFAMEEFNRACNTLSELAFQHDLHRQYDIHHQGYRLIRQETSLPSQHVINAIAKVSAVYTRDSNKWRQFKPHSSLRYDAKSMTLGSDCQTVSLAVCPKGRVTAGCRCPPGCANNFNRANSAPQNWSVARGTSTCIFRSRSRSRKLNNHRAASASISASAAWRCHLTISSTRRR